MILYLWNEIWYETYVFLLRFGLANAINYYKRLKFRVVFEGNFQPLMLINWIFHTKSESDLLLYTRNLQTERFRPVLSSKSSFEFGFFLCKKGGMICFIDIILMRNFKIQYNIKILIDRAYILFNRYIFVYHNHNMIKRLLFEIKYIKLRKVFFLYRYNI